MYRVYGIDAALAQQRICENLASFRWSAPLGLTTLFSALIVGTIIPESLFLIFG
jgi:F0F1-type ATP synthase membrane subunit c/vacuolar-type H+-ATPase subunit K